MKGFEIDSIKFGNNNHFPPVFTPGVGQKEMVDDNGLKGSMRYLNNVGVDGKDLIAALYRNYPAPMLDEMIKTIRKHKPDVTDAELAITITNHI